MKRILVVAYGSMGRNYCQLIRSGMIEGLQLVAVVCRHPDKHPDLVEKVYTTMEEAMLHAQDFDAAIITSPHKTHVGYVLMALEHGLEVLCEKPVSDSLMSIEPLLELPDEMKNKVSLVFNWRQRPEIIALRNEVQKLGRISTIVWVANFWYRTNWYHRSAAWRSSWKNEGGGLLVNQAQHLFDVWAYVFGLPDSVFAKVDYGKWRDIMVDDDFTALFNYSKGTRGVLISSTVDSPGSNHLEVHGEFGKIVLDGRQLTVERNSCSSIDNAWSATVQDGMEHCTENFSFSSTDEYAQVLSSFSCGRKMAKLEDGVNALTMAQSIYLSDWQGKEVPVRNNKENYSAFIREKLEEEENCTGRKTGR